jgi:hypothetical protein
MGNDRSRCINCHLPELKRCDHPFFGVDPRLLLRRSALIDDSEHRSTTTSPEKSRDPIQRRSQCYNKAALRWNSQSSDERKSPKHQLNNGCWFTRLPERRGLALPPYLTLPWRTFDRTIGTKDAAVA